MTAAAHNQLDSLFRDCAALYNAALEERIDCYRKRAVLRKCSSLTVALTLSVVSSTHVMATDEGFYISLGAGAAFVNDADVKAHDNPAYSSPFDGETGGEWGVPFTARSATASPTACV